MFIIDPAIFTGHITDKREAVQAVRAEADALIEQMQRRAQGWDKGNFRDDDTLRREPIAAVCAFRSDLAFALPRKFA